VAERVGVEPGEPVAPAGAAEKDRPLVADESPAAAGEDQWPVDQARQVRLAAAGGKRSDPAGCSGRW
jgi:hypothetical protein